MKLFPDKDTREAWVHRLGNLVLLSRKKNSEAQNFEFDVKKRTYFSADATTVSSPFILTTRVLNIPEWTPEVLQDRQTALLSKLKELWGLEEWDVESARNEGGTGNGGMEKTIQGEKKIPERYDIRERFWAGLLAKAREKTKLHVNVKPGQFGWIGAGSGKRGLGFNYAVREHDVQVELYIDRGKGAEQENKVIFDQFMIMKEEIESAFGDDLDWQRLDEGRACRIRKVIGVGGYRDPEKWAEIYEAASEAMARFEKAMKPAIARLKF